jgi:transketolase
MHTIKPIDDEKIKYLSKKNKLILTVEEHNVIGGLGSAVAEILSNHNNNCKLIRVGINDFYSSGGSYDYLKDIYGLSVEKIVTAVLLNLKHEK